MSTNSTAQSGRQDAVSSIQGLVNYVDGLIGTVIDADDAIELIERLRDAQKGIKQTEALAEASEAYLTKVAGMTTDDFSTGGEKAEREALRLQLLKFKGEA